MTSPIKKIIEYFVVKDKIQEEEKPIEKKVKTVGLKTIPEEPEWASKKDCYNTFYSD